MQFKNLLKLLRENSPEITYINAKLIDDAPFGNDSTSTGHRYKKFNLSQMRALCEAASQNTIVTKVNTGGTGTGDDIEDYDDDYQDYVAWLGNICAKNKHLKQKPSLVETIADNFETFFLTPLLSPVSLVKLCVEYGRSTWNWNQKMQEHAVNIQESEIAVTVNKLKDKEIGPALLFVEYMLRENPEAKVIEIAIQHFEERANKNPSEEKAAMFACAHLLYEHTENTELAKEYLQKCGKDYSDANILLKMIIARENEQPLLSHEVYSTTTNVNLILSSSKEEPAITISEIKSPLASKESSLPSGSYNFLSQQQKNKSQVKERGEDDHLMGLDPTSPSYRF
jgi:hypothetical protein